MFGMQDDHIVVNRQITLWPFVESKLGLVGRGANVTCVAPFYQKWGTDMSSSVLSCLGIQTLF